VHKYLDKPPFHKDTIHHTDLIGDINGLYATDYGIGGILPIQIRKNHICGPDSGNKHLKPKITGNQKQVMKESIMCALTVALGILSDSVRERINSCNKYRFHIHACDAASLKDGPSAGCAFTTAFVSLLLGKKINRYVAMTGEIDLTGKVNAIGGLSAKLMGAKRAGIKTVYICEENRKDLELIKKKSPELFDDTFGVVVIKHIIDIVTNPNILLETDPNDFNMEGSPMISN